MSEKKKGILKGLFKSKSGCGCGVSIVEEPEINEKKKDDKSQNK